MVGFDLQYVKEQTNFYTRIFPKVLAHFTSCLVDRIQRTHRFGRDMMVFLFDLTLLWKGNVIVDPKLGHN